MVKVLLFIDKRDNIVLRSLTQVPTSAILSVAPLPGFVLVTALFTAKG
jgi:hypothetical protein